MEILIRFRSPYIYLCADCQKWWTGMDEFRKEPNPHLGHSVMAIRTDKQENQ